MCSYEIHWHIHNHVCFNRETILYTLNILIIGFSPPVALVSHHFLYTLPFIYFSIFYHVRCSNLHLVKTPTQAYYSAESQNTPLLRYSNDSFIRLQNTHPFSLLNIPQTAENQGFLESRQTVSICVSLSKLKLISSSIIGSLNLMDLSHWPFGCRSS